MEKVISSSIKLELFGHFCWDLVLDCNFYFWTVRWKLVTASRTCCYLCYLCVGRCLDCLCHSRVSAAQLGQQVLGAWREVGSRAGFHHLCAQLHLTPPPCVDEFWVSVAKVEGSPSWWVLYRLHFFPTVLNCLFLKNNCSLAQIFIIS